MISENEDKTLSEIGIDFSSSKKRTTIKIVPISSLVHRRSAIVSEADSTLPSSLDDEELALGASASPVEPTSSPIPLPLFSEEPVTRNHNDSLSLYPCTSYFIYIHKTIIIIIFFFLQFQRPHHVHLPAMLVLSIKR